MLMQTFAAPASRLGSSWARGLISVVVPARAHALNCYALHGQSASKATLRDHNRPKRPISGYLFFASELRQKGTQDLGAIAQSWAKLSLVEKAPYVKKGHDEQAAYKIKIDEYKASGQADAFSRDPAKPRRPATAYLLWAAAQRESPQFSNLCVSEAAKVLGSNWAAVPAEKKDPLVAKYKADMEVFMVQMKEYRESGSEEDWLERTGRMERMKTAEAKAQKEKDKLREQKDKKKAKEANAREKVKADAAKEKDKKKAAKEKATLALATQKAKEKEAKEKVQKKAALAKEKKQLARQKAKATKA